MQTLLNGMELKTLETVEFFESIDYTVKVSQDQQRVFIIKKGKIDKVLTIKEYLDMVFKE